MDGKFTDSVASSSDSLEGVHAHAINTRPSFLPRGAGSEARHTHASGADPEICKGGFNYDVISRTVS